MNLIEMWNQMGFFAKANAPPASIGTCAAIDFAWAEAAVPSRTGTALSATGPEGPRRQPGPAG